MMSEENDWCIDGLIGKITCTVDETYDDFIFACIAPYCREKTQLKINKQLLVRALLTFRKEHPDEYHNLTK